MQKEPDDLKVDDEETTTTSSTKTSSDENRDLAELSKDINIFQSAKMFLKLSISYSAASFILIGGNFVGVIFISKLGPKVLAASNLTSSIQNWFTSTVGTALGSASTVAGRKIGKNKSSRVGNILQKSWIIALISSVPTVSFMLASKPILLLLQQDPEVVELSKEYFYGYAAGLPAMFLLSCNRKIALATGNPNVSLFFITLYQIADTALSYALIFGKFYLPELGIAGLGYSNSITAWGTFLLFTGYMATSKRFKEYDILRLDLNKFGKRLLELVKIGLPMGIKVATELASLLIASLMIGVLGADQQAAEEASFQYIFVLSTPLFGIMDTANTLVSRSVGAKNIRNAKKLGYTGISLGVLISLVGLIFFIFMPNLLLKAFIKEDQHDNQEIMHTARMLLLVNGVGQVADAVRNISLGGLNGFYKRDIYRNIIIPTVSMVLILLLVNIPLAYVMGFPLDMGAVGVMTARDIGMAIGAIFLFFLWVRTGERPSEQHTNTAIAPAITEENDVSARVGINTDIDEKNRYGTFFPRHNFFGFRSSSVTSLQQSKKSSKCVIS